MKTLFYNNHEIVLDVDTYTYSNSIAIAAYTTDGEPYADLTVCLDFLMPNFAFVDVNNFPDAEELIGRYKLGKPTGTKRKSGYVEYPLYEFDIEELQKYVPEVN